MTATSPVSPGRSASPIPADRSETRWFRALLLVDRSARATGPFCPKVARAAVASALSAIARALAASLAPDTLTTAKIATLTGVTEVHHG